MLADKRHSMILGIVNDEGSATVGDLAERIGISESTIRRDLAQLADAGKLNKVHGGAVALDAEDVQHDVPVAERSAKNVAQKRAIAQAAARLVGPQDFVYLDAGSSVDLLVDCLDEMRATYATDSSSWPRVALRSSSWEAASRAPRRPSLVPTPTRPLPATTSRWASGAPTASRARTASPRPMPPRPRSSASPCARPSTASCSRTPARRTA